MARLLPRDGVVTTIEINRRNAETARRDIRAAGLGGKARGLNGDAVEIIPKLRGVLTSFLSMLPKSERTLL